MSPVKSIKVSSRNKMVTLFIIVLEALSKKFRIGLPWELVYVDDLVLVAESEEKLLQAMERRYGAERAQS